MELTLSSPSQALCTLFQKFEKHLFPIRMVSWGPCEVLPGHNYWKRATAFSLTAFVSLGEWGEDGMFKGLLQSLNMYAAL